MTLRELDDYQHDDVAQRTRRKRNFFDPETGDVEKDSPRTLLVEEYVMTRHQNSVETRKMTMAQIQRAKKNCLDLLLATSTLQRVTVLPSQGHQRA